MILEKYFRSWTPPPSWKSLNKFDFRIPKSATCHVCLKLAEWFLRKRCKFEKCTDERRTQAIIEACMSLGDLTREPKLWLLWRLISLALLEPTPINIFQFGTEVRWKTQIPYHYNIGHLTRNKLTTNCKHFSFRIGQTIPVCLIHILNIFVFAWFFFYMRIISYFSVLDDTERLKYILRASNLFLKNY